MSMLAERKRKQKWSLNPRGKDWSEDSNKFGQKLLEKMGWKTGKGLGANENGIVEHVKVPYKNDSRGMGYVENTEQWTEQQENFGKLLEILQNDNHISSTTREQIISLEEKSSNSKARVHYKKFTRGKDLSRYSEKDLANILGKKTLKESAKVKEEPTTDSDGKDNNEKEFGVETIQRGSMHDYFKSKLPNFNMNKQYNVGSNGVLKAEVQSDSETERPSFGNGFKGNSDSETERPAFGFGFKTEIVAEESSKASIDESSNMVKEKKMKKSKVKREVEELDNGKEKKMTFVSYLQDESELSIAESTEKSSKKKKKRKTESLEGDLDVDSEPKRRKLEEQSERIDKKKAKKKRKEAVEIGISNPAFDPMSNNITVDKHILQPINEVEECKDQSLEYEEVINTEKRSKNKKKRNKRELNGFINPELCLDDENETAIEIVPENPYEVKEKRKKNKKRKEEDLYALDNPNFDIDAPTMSAAENNDFEVTRTEKKKKKKKKDKENCEDLGKEIAKEEETNLENDISCDIMLNVTATPVLQNTIKIEDESTWSIKKRNAPKRRKSVRFSDVNEERIIPNKDELKELENRLELEEINTTVINEGQAKKESIRGMENAGFNEAAVKLEENLIGIKRKFENCQAEIENDMNEAKVNKRCDDNTRYIGIIGSDKDEHEKTEDGVLLAFKKAKFGRPPRYLANQLSGPKKSIRGLIKGDIVLKFPNCNLHTVNGYGKSESNKNKH